MLQNQSKQAYLEKYKNTFFLRKKPNTKLKWKLYQLLFQAWIIVARITKRSFERNRQDFERIIAGLPLRGDLIDIGGGVGWMSEYWTGGENERYVVLDPLFRKDLLKQKAYLKNKLIYVEGNAENIALKSATFATAILAAAIDHVENPQKVLRETRRVLKKGGHLLVVQQVKPTRKSRAGHISNFDRNELEQAISENFKIEKSILLKSSQVMYIWSVKE